jgi:hypothetical protein
MRARLFAALLAMAAPLASAGAQLSIQFSLPGIEIGVRQPTYPQLVLVPGYPVYYDPSAQTNYFFYDGLYWVYEGDNWYASSWYDGPWGLVEPRYVPVFILRVPVSYYRRPPAYFQGWRRDAPPRWGDHWGRDWEARRSGWDRWDRQRGPRPAPLPSYQRHYAGDRYPQADQQPALRRDLYQYAPRDPVVKQIVRAPEPARPAPREGDRREQGNQRPGDRAPPPPPSRERGLPQAQPQRRERPDDTRAEPKKGERGSDRPRGQDRDGKDDGKDRNARHDD